MTEANVPSVFDACPLHHNFFCFLKGALTSEVATTEGSQKEKVCHPHHGLALSICSLKASELSFVKVKNNLPGQVWHLIFYLAVLITRASVHFVLVALRKREEQIAGRVILLLKMKVAAHPTWRL